MAITDIPERKDDPVRGEYRLTVPKSSTAPIAVKTTDILGEEVLVMLAQADPADATASA